MSDINSGIPGTVPEPDPTAPMPVPVPGAAASATPIAAVPLGAPADLPVPGEPPAAPAAPGPAAPGPAAPGPAAPAAPAPLAAPKGAAITALVTGLAGLLLVTAFMTTEAGGLALWGGALLGLLGLIFGTVALRKRQSKPMAVVGLIAGALAMVSALALFAFALIFVGAFLSIAA